MISVTSRSGEQLPRSLSEREWSPTRAISDARLLQHSYYSDKVILVSGSPSRAVGWRYISMNRTVPPPWLSVVAERLTQLACLPRNWDGYNSPTPAIDVVE